MAHNTGRILHIQRDQERFAEDTRSANDTISIESRKDPIPLPDAEPRNVTTSLIELPSCARPPLGAYGNPRAEPRASPHSLRGPRETKFVTESGTSLHWDQEECDRLFSECWLTFKIMFQNIC